METTNPYTPESLATHWGCSARQIRKLAQTGAIPCFRVGRLLRIPANFVRARDNGEAWTPTDASR